jgi:Arc/MetJ-type ribon-helix-helix transcriptional regulator
MVYLAIFGCFNVKLNIGGSCRAGRMPMPVVTISLSPELATKVKDAVADGSFASDSDVICDVLQRWSHDKTIDLTTYVRPLRNREPSEADVEALFAAFKGNKLPRGDA